jgi:transposase
MPYSSSLTDKEWEVIEPLLLEALPPNKRTRPSNWTKREIFYGILYQLKNGCNWQDLLRALLNRLLALQAMARSRGTREIDECAASKSPRTSKKKPKWTTLIIIDSQAVKNTCNASVDSKGFCFYKATNGIKRHLAIDTLGFPFFTYCTRANISDNAGLIEMLSLNIDYFKSKPVHIPKITILLDHGYHPDRLTEALQQVYPQIMTKIKFELSTKPSKQEKLDLGKSGFVPAIARWVVERSNAWMDRCKILTKNFERTLSNATAKINLCFIRPMLKRIAAFP